jgi:hypothetical protein
MLPDEEIDAFLTTVDDAIACAAEGRFAGGFDLLVKGLRQARCERIAGRPWAKELIGRYQTALDNYCISYGVRLG